MILDTACIYSGVFLKSLKLIFEKLWRDFCCWVLWTCLYDYQIKLELLLLVINLECFVYQSQLIRVNEDPSKAACLLLACLLAACLLIAHGEGETHGGFYFVLGNPPDGPPAGAPKNPKTHPKSAQIDPGPVPTPPKSMFAHLGVCLTSPTDHIRPQLWPFEVWKSQKFTPWFSTCLPPPAEKVVTLFCAMNRLREGHSEKIYALKWRLLSARESSTLI